MPEGPEVSIIAQVVRSCQDLLFSHAEIIQKPHFSHKYVRKGIKDFDKLQKPFKITEVQTKGKLIRIDITSICGQCSTPEGHNTYMIPHADENGNPGWQLCPCKNKAKFSILNTLGMSGTWGHNFKDHDHARIVLHLQQPSQWENLTFIDQRSFGTIKIVTPTEADKRVKKVGWDLLKAPMSDDDWARLQTNASLSQLEVGEALMTQNKFSGIGNIYKAEVLYESKIHPQTLVKDLDPAKWAKLNPTAHQIMAEARRQGGSSVQSYMANGKKGNYQNHLRVYQKDKCPIGHNVDSIKQDGRSSWFCSICQL